MFTALLRWLLDSNNKCCQSSLALAFFTVFSLAGYGDDDWFTTRVAKGMHAMVWYGETEEEELHANVEILRELLKDYRASSPYYIPSLFADIHALLLQNADLLSDKDFRWLLSHKKELEKAANVTLGDVIEWRRVPPEVSKKKKKKKKHEKNVRELKAVEADEEVPLDIASQTLREQPDKWFDRLRGEIKQCRNPEKLEETVELQREAHESLEKLDRKLYESLQRFIQKHRHELTERRFGHLNHHDRKHYLKELDGFLQKHHLVKVDVPGDDNCIPSVLAEQLTHRSASNHQYTSQEVRRHLADHYQSLQSNDPQHILVAVLGDWGQENIGEDKSWMDVQPTLMLAADRYQYPVIHVYPRGRSPVVETYWPNSHALVSRHPFQQALIIIHNGYGHYDAAIYKPDRSRSEHKPHKKRESSSKRSIIIQEPVHATSHKDPQQVDQLKREAEAYLKQALNLSVDSSFEHELVRVSIPDDFGQGDTDDWLDLLEATSSSAGIVPASGNSTVIAEESENDPEFDAALESLKQRLAAFEKGEKSEEDGLESLYLLLEQSRGRTMDLPLLMKDMGGDTDLQIVAPGDVRLNHGFFSVLCELIGQGTAGVMRRQQRSAMQCKHGLQSGMKLLQEDNYLWDTINILYTGLQWAELFQHPDIWTSLGSDSDPLWNRPEIFWLLAMHLGRDIIISLPTEDKCSGIVYSPSSAPQVLHYKQLAEAAGQLHRGHSSPLMMAYDGFCWSAIQLKAEEGGQEAEKDVEDIDAELERDTDTGQLLHLLDEESQEHRAKSKTVSMTPSSSTLLKKDFRKNIQKVIRLHCNQQWDGVVRLLKKDVHKFPRIFRVTARYYLAQAYLKLKNKEKFLEQFEKLQNAVSMDDLEGRLKVIILKKSGEGYLRRLKLSQAIEDLDDMPIEGPRSYILHLARIYEIKFSAYLKAIGCLQKYLDHHKHDWQVALSINVLIQKIKDRSRRDQLFSELAPVLTQLHQRNPGNHSITIAYAINCAQQGMWSRGIEALEQAGLENIKVLEAWLSLVLRSEENAEHFDKAYQYLTPVYKKTPILQKMWLRLHSYERDPEKVKVILPEAVVMVNASRGSKHYYANLISLQKFYVTLNYAFQLDELSHMMRHRHPGRRHFNETGVIIQNLYLGRYKKAQRLADRAVKSWPKVPHIYALQARAHSKARSPDAAELMNGLVTWFRRNPVKLRNLAMEVQRYYEEKDELQKQYEILVEINDNNKNFQTARKKLVHVGLRAGDYLSDQPDAYSKAADCYRRSFACNRSSVDGLTSGYKALLLYAKRNDKERFWGFVELFETCRNESELWKKHCQLGKDPFIEELDQFKNSISRPANLRGYRKRWHITGD
ncbi:hypothetical protein M3P05_13905 [Sansalvadorimonas sp. 2012CJ34-2]|uniref:Tetratricopeptide repeat protein n=1 Tax=Parendozoicomonas callyspongiae TaxID=2942213 RepID=A0ABT0PIE9_9GAMM|nr:OTU domain-containing protein [Sansalvadorimonas sp. 2012CJ34-2]MCL6271021.1 hypothetical protein [Sansalvadorimonas sp. 2012CJ34-2]